ncbi:hypothetical protein [Kitasatospora purpeofusca]|nr:hypothetical protein [Kitasatospora purpeofusca]MCX4690758.1 hypothetical protein [Kitasatospora purpeofusca]WSR46019.1 hypothetical protein OG196_43760 [Kitasatospora purpeofusca]
MTSFTIVVWAVIHDPASASATSAAHSSRASPAATGRPGPGVLYW